MPEQKPMDKNLVYLSRCIAHDMYYITLIDLNQDSYQVISATPFEASLTPSNTSSYSAWIQSHLDSGIVHSDDLKRVAAKTSLAELKNLFQTKENKLAVWYRRKKNHTFNWVVMRMIPAEDFTPENPKILMYIQDDDIEAEFEMNAVASSQLQYLRAMSAIYQSMHIIDMKKDTVMELRSTPFIRKYMKHYHNATSQMMAVISNVVDESMADKALTFCDLYTLQKRMRRKKSISEEFIGLHFGWFRIQFIAISYDEEGTLEQVVFTTQIIDDQKRREQELIKESNTDGLTKVYNRHCYEADMLQLRSEKVNDNLIYISVDANQLKETNDQYGHAAGDELLCGIANMLFDTLGDHGRIYRIGGDEFIAILHYPPIVTETLLNHLRDEMNKWHGELIPSLTYSLGYAGYDEFPNADIDYLAKIADSRMYQDKNAYYIRKGIDRRRR